MPKLKKTSTDTSILDVVPALGDRLEAIMRISTKAATRWGYPDAVAIPSESPDLFRRRVFSSGLLSVDHSLKIGGFPRSAITEFYGAPHTGKSLMLYMTMAAAQHQCMHCEGLLTYHDLLDAKGNQVKVSRTMVVRGEETSIDIVQRTSICADCGNRDTGALCVLFDQESSFDPIWAQKQGIELTKLFTVKLPNGEQVSEMLRTIMISAKPDLIGIDSIAQLQPRTEQIKSEVDDKVMPGLHAKIMAQLCRHLTSIFNMDPRNAPAIIWVNQIRADMSGYGADKVTGGFAPEHYSSIRIKFSIGQYVNQKHPQMGRKGKLFFKKCKSASGVKDRTIEYILVDSGFDKAKDVYETAVASDVFLTSSLTSGSHYWADDTGKLNKLASSRDEMMSLLRSDSTLNQEIRKRVLASQVSTLPELSEAELPEAYSGEEDAEDTVELELTESEE